MTAVGIALVFVGYSLTLYGWILLRGYNVSLANLFNQHPWPSTPQPGD